VNHLTKINIINEDNTYLLNLNYSYNLDIVLKQF
jgi:hypothetical protein